MCHNLLKSALTEYGENKKTDDPLADVKPQRVSPFLLKIPK
jgi:hypothetical protein